MPKRYEDLAKLLLDKLGLDGLKALSILLKEDPQGFLHYEIDKAIVARDPDFFRRIGKAPFGERSE